MNTESKAENAPLAKKERKSSPGVRNSRFQTVPTAFPHCLNRREKTHRKSARPGISRPPAVGRRDSKGMEWSKNIQGDGENGSSSESAPVVPVLQFGHECTRFRSRHQRDQQLIRTPALFSVFGAKQVLPPASWNCWLARGNAARRVAGSGWNDNHLRHKNICKKDKNPVDSRTSFAKIHNSWWMVMAFVDKYVVALSN